MARRVTAAGPGVRRARRLRPRVMRRCARCGETITLYETPEGRWLTQGGYSDCPHLPIFTPEEMRKAAEEIGEALGSADVDDDI